MKLYCIQSPQISLKCRRPGYPNQKANNYVRDMYHRTTHIITDEFKGGNNKNANQKFDERRYNKAIEDNYQLRLLREFLDME